MPFETMPQSTVLHDWLDHVDARLPACPQAAALRAALAGDGEPDPGFQRLTRLMRTVLQAEQLLDGPPALRDGADAAEQRLAQLFHAGLTNAVRQLESFIGIQHYLRHGETLSSFHGWSISPDIGMWLVERLNGQAHDLIIEFGSGTSTWLLAKAMQARLRHRGRPPRWTTRPLERRIVSFEHDATYLASTQRSLKAHGVDQQVQLLHTPLVTWQDGAESCLFYDCRQHLRRLAAALRPVGARILVLVDGPPGHIGRHARYPAVPHVFEVMGHHHIDIVLDDAHRPDEKAVIERWRGYWTERSIPIEEHAIPSEKGLYAATTLTTDPNRGSHP